MAERRVIRHISLRSIASMGPDAAAKVQDGYRLRDGIRTRNGGDCRVECVTPILTPAFAAAAMDEVRRAVTASLPARRSVLQPTADELPQIAAKSVQR